MVAVLRCGVFFPLNPLCINNYEAPHPQNRTHILENGLEQNLVDVTGNIVKTYFHLFRMQTMVLNTQDIM